MQKVAPFSIADKLAANVLTRIGWPKAKAAGVNEIATAFVAACRDEIEAPKPGNVHVFAEGHGMTVRDFLRSAEAAAPALCKPSTPVGARILTAVEATFAAVGMNTNLGIILLCAPLAAAAESRRGICALLCTRPLLD